MESHSAFVYPESLNVERLTPDSTASSSKRFFTNSLSNSGEKREFSVLGLEESRASYTNNAHSTGGLADSTRHAIGMLHTPQDETPRQRTLERTDHSDKNKEFDEETENKGRCLPKLLLFLFVVILVLAGIVVLVVSRKDSKPEAKTGSIIEDEPEDNGDPSIGDCPAVEVNLRDRIYIYCTTSLVSQNDVTSLLIVPPAYVNKGQNISLNINSNNVSGSDWSVSLDLIGQLNLTGPLATCSSSGTYRLHILDKQNTSLYSAETVLKVKSEVLQVNVSLNQSISNSSSEFTVGCSTNSGCEQSFVDFFAEINKEEQYLRGVNFTCEIKYNDYDGYSVSCVGTIPDFLMAQFGRITCRPRSDLLDNYTKEEIQKLEQVLELPECDISKHCGYKCTDMGDYFVVNSGRCDIFHRCYEGRVFSEYCAPGTFFDPVECSCRHTTDLSWCQSNGALKPNLYQDIEQKECYTSNP